ncbi:MAG TPA: formylglycine-generating enzyme family protein [Saprospiraceae bacterium]|nr:formylglycine-generating enzyme family protein [Saprospiraceae bacterium]HMQ83122.1 formylglycine-generating enzyme family protein [Saprospiraceae bacterium]
MTTAMAIQRKTYLGLPTFVTTEIPGNSFMMGSEENDAEKPVHRVQIAPFEMGAFPVTQELWQHVMGDNPACFKGDNRPVEQVSWNQVQVFLEKLNALPAIAACQAQDNRRFQLPSEAQWEYAARGGPLSKGYRYAGGNKLKEVGWFWENSHGETKPVGLKRPNELGLYDMSGNVWEWCANTWHDNYDKAPLDGNARQGNDSAGRVVRGGSWYYGDYYCRVSYRFRDNAAGRDYDVGFRLARY